MKNIIRAIGTAIWILLLLSVAAGAGSDWEYLYTKDDIDIYRKTFPGTEVCAFKGTGFVDAPMEVVGCVLRDIPAYPQWMAKCKQAEVLKDIDRNTKIIYNVIETPPPYKHRDMIVENKTLYNLENGTAVITFGISKEKIAVPKNDYQRVTELSGEYLIEYFGREKTRVSYSHRADPGGNVPVGIANWVEIKNYPYINIQGLRQMVKKQKYIDEGKRSPEYELIETMGTDIRHVRTIIKNRIGEYVTDPKLLDMTFSEQMVQDLVELVYAEKSSFKSVQQAVLGLFYVSATSPAIEAYIQDKRLEEFFSIDMLMREKWLVDMLSKERALIESFLDANSSSAEKLFHKITTSEKAVRTFIKERSLADKILTNPDIRKKLWADAQLRKNILDRVGSFESIAEFEKIVKDRVDHFI